MVHLQLSIQAELENVTELQPSSEIFEYHFKVKCTSCNEEHAKLISINRVDEYDVPAGKHSKAHFVWTCSICERRSTAKFDTSKKITPYTSDNAQFQPLLVVECRGLEFTDFDFRGHWKCTGTTGKVFDDIDLGEGDWTEYDDMAKKPVGISECKSQWSRA